MKSKSRGNTKTLVLGITGGLLIAMVSLFLLRGWVRMTVLPKAVTVVYGNPAEKVYKDEMGKLQDPLTSLGFSATPAPPPGCRTVLANKIKTQVDCDYIISSDRTVDTDQANQANIIAKAQTLQALLKSNGWEGEYSDDGQPYTSLVKLVTSVSSGVDYQSDATYQKNVGGVKCYLQINTAFSKPAPPALSIHIACARTINVFGQPSWQ